MSGWHWRDCASRIGKPCDMACDSNDADAVYRAGDRFRAKDGEPRSIDDIKARLLAATPGPWVAFRELEDGTTIGTPVAYMDEDERIVVGPRGDWGEYVSAKADADFIANAPDDVAFLLARVRALEAELAEARGA